MTAFNSIFLRDATVATQGAKVDSFGTQFVNLRTAGGVEAGTTTTPVVVQIASGGITISNTAFGISGSLPSGTNSIGTVILGGGGQVIGSISNTTFGITGALPTGANTIGSISLVGTAKGTSVALGVTVKAIDANTNAQDVAVNGAVTIAGTVPISGTVGISGTVPISGTVSVSGTVPISGTVALSGTSSVSGTVTGNQGTPNSTVNAWPVKTTDGTNTASINANTELSIGGGVVAGSTDSGNPLKMGGRASTTLTVLSGGQRTNQAFDVLGRAVNTPALPDSLVTGQVALTTTTSTVLLPASVGQRNYVQDLLLSNGSATGVTVLILDGTTLLMQIYLAAQGTPVPYALNVPLRGSVNTALNAQLSLATASGGVYVHSAGYTAPY